MLWTNHWIIHSNPSIMTETFFVSTNLLRDSRKCIYFECHWKVIHLFCTVLVFFIKLYTSPSSFMNEIQTQNTHSIGKKLFLLHIISLLHITITYQASYYFLTFFSEKLFFIFFIFIYVWTFYLYFCSPAVKMKNKVAFPKYCLRFKDCKLPLVSNQKPWECSIWACELGKLNHEAEGFKKAQVSITLWFSDSCHSVR